MTEASQLGPSADGSVLLDIGGDRGALIITTSPSLAGAEIEISRVGAGTPRTHVAVRERRGPTGSRYAAIFASLPAGDYLVWSPDGTPADNVIITGGHVTELRW